MIYKKKGAYLVDRAVDTGSFVVYSAECGYSFRFRVLQSYELYLRINGKRIMTYSSPDQVCF